MKTAPRLLFLFLLAVIAACASPPAKPPADSHLQQADAPVPDSAIPSPVQQSLNLPKPKVGAKAETYSVIVNNVRVHELLFALARDAKVNVDIHPGINGVVTLNAIDQTLPQILNRLAKQLDLRWEIDGQNLAVMPDTPYLQNYKVDYVNMKRDASGSIQVSGEIADSSAGGGSSNNSSSAKVDNTAKNHFWETLVKNLQDMLRETDKILPEGSSDTVVEQSGSKQGAGAILAEKGSAKAALAALPPGQSSSTDTTVVKRTTFREAASVISNPETGIISVRATSRQHEKIQLFLDLVMVSAKRQVLIEATIAEVELTREFQQGVDWARFGSTATSNGLFVSQAGSAVTGAGLLTLSGRRDTSSGGATFTSAIRLLETFGAVKVLSSPKISALNNQTAILKVVDNQVYFNVKATTNTNNTSSITTFSTEQRVVPVGFVMNVTPQISSGDEVVLNVRPSITRVIGTEADPNPSLVFTNAAGIQERIANLVPIIRTREMESVIRVQNGAIAVMGGLMEDKIEKQDSAVPWFHSIPLIGALFSQKRSASTKTELVIFLRPTVIREADINVDFNRIREHLPNKDFFANNPGVPYQLLPSAKEDAKK